MANKIYNIYHISKANLRAVDHVSAPNRKAAWGVFLAKKQNLRKGGYLVARPTELVKMTYRKN